VVAGLQRGHARAHLEHDARAFMAENRGEQPFGVGARQRVNSSVWQMPVALISTSTSPDPWSQNQVGNLYMLGLGTEVNMEEALKWYMRAALNNWADAQINVSLMYRYGRGVPSDLVRSWAWLRHARSNGKEIAEIYMSWMAGSLTLTPSQMQVAKERYFELESLRPEGFK
jgi:TPR repeat protein